MFCIYLRVSNGSTSSRNLGMFERSLGGWIYLSICHIEIEVEANVRNYGAMKICICMYVYVYMCVFM